MFFKQPWITGRCSHEAGRIVMNKLVNCSLNSRNKKESGESLIYSSSLPFHSKVFYSHFIIRQSVKNLLLA